MHIISLYYPNLYLQLYCNPRPPKECNYFLVENIYGEFTLCTKIHKKAKNKSETFNSLISKNIASPSLLNYNNIDNYLTKNLTYSFIYKSVTYEYDEECNKIIPVYMDLSKITNKEIFNYFGEGLSSNNLVKKFYERYGKNEYCINLNISQFYFKKIEIKDFVFIIGLKLFDLTSGDYLTVIIFSFIILATLFAEFIATKKVIYDLYKEEYTLDGEINKLKVKRKYKLENDFYYEIKNCDLLPGDIIFLKTNDYIPCDCLILEGECIVKENNLTGSFNIFKKISLENNNDQFNYKLNKNNLLYHGMKIIKTYSKLNEGYISALCINTGARTFKANLYSNILYMFERNKKYKGLYKFCGTGRKSLFISMIIIFFFSILLGIFFFFFTWQLKFDFNDAHFKKNIYITVAKLISKSSMPVYFITNSIIYITSVLYLKNEKIICFDKTKLISSSIIDTIFFCKSGTLCNNNLEINGYHPIFINPSKPNSIGYKSYKVNQYKEMNFQLLNYYQDYLKKCKNDNQKNKDFNIRQAMRVELGQKNFEQIKQQSYEYSCLFQECLLSCNNIEKHNTEFFGNPIEKKIFLNLRWDIKPLNFNDDYKTKKNNIEVFSNSNQINDENLKCCENEYNFIDRNINDIYPNNYYKITQSMKTEIKNKKKPIITRLNSRYYSQLTEKFKNKKEKNSNTSFIKDNISKSCIHNYRLRIFKRFIIEGTLSSSAIVYNFITKELRFMTKGIPEDIINKCDYNSLPNNINNIICLYRKMGLIILACASKIINIDDYKDSCSIEDYMNNLDFCGFITLKYNLKNEILNSINELKQFNCNLIITSGDNVYNTLSVGFLSNIIENKDIFMFDKVEDKNKIIITKIYKAKKLNEEEKENEEKEGKSLNASSFEKYSKQTTRISNSQYSKSKDNIIFSPNLKKVKNKNKKRSLLKNQTNDSEKRRLYIDNFNEEETNKNSLRKRGDLKKNFKETKKIFNNDKKGEEFVHKNTQAFSDFSDRVEINKENDIKFDIKLDKIKSLDLPEKNNQRNNPYDKNKSLIYNNKEDSSIYKMSKNKFFQNFSYLEKHYYYPGIFEDYENLANNCIYCVSGKVFIII